MSDTKPGLPKMTIYLGYGGLIPFIFLAWVSIVNYDLGQILNMTVELWMAIYASVILSFLGAIHWGVVLAMPDGLSEREKTIMLIYSIAPSLLAWLSFLCSLKLALFILAATVLISYFFDRLFLFKKLDRRLSNEFSKLRLNLTTVVFLSLLIVALNMG